MPIYHCSIKIISRAGGRSAVASAAYRSGEKLLNEETGIVHDFTRKSGVVYNEIILPENAPTEYVDRTKLWNDVQKVESRSDARFAREVEVALPVEMNRDQQLECVRNYVHENFVSKGMIADWALHDKGDGNPHAHIMLTCRGFDEKGSWEQKTKSVYANDRDEDGRPVYRPDKPSYDPKDRENTSAYRIPQLDENGQQKYRERKGKGKEMLWERINIPANDWNDRKNAETWRASWAEHCNKYLEPGHRIDHRSYKRQGIDKEPTIHEGVTARKMEQNGNTADRCQINREIRERNLIHEQLKEIAKEITKTVIEKARDILGRFKEFRRNHGNIETAGRNAGYSGKPARRDRKPGFGKPEFERTAGRINELKRTVDETAESIKQTDKDIAVTDTKIERIKELIRGKEAMRNERLERLKRRRSALDDGGNAGSDRRSANEHGDGIAEEFRSAKRDIEDFLGKLTSTENASAEKRNDRIAERKDRESIRERLDFEEKRRTDKAKQGTAEEKRDSGNRHEESQAIRRKRGRGR